MDPRDTIVAIATPPGRGGLGIVRLSGSDAVTIANQLVRVRSPLVSWSSVRGELLDAAGQLVDDVLITWFARPRSYTSEDVVEIACHGSPVVLRTGVERALECGRKAGRTGRIHLKSLPPRAHRSSPSRSHTRSH